MKSLAPSDTLDIYAPRDKELNSEGEKQQVKNANQANEEEDSQAGTQRRSRKGSRWDAVSSPEDDGREAKQLLLASLRTHWQQMSPVRAGDVGSTEMGMGLNLVKRILFADAVCGMHTPHGILDNMLWLWSINFRIPKLFTFFFSRVHYQKSPEILEMITSYSKLSKKKKNT